MAIAPFQQQVLRLLGTARRERGESYVVGGVALNVLLNAARISQTNYRTHFAARKAVREIFTR